MSGKLRTMMRRRERSYALHIPRAEEAEHILLLGDPGTGKSQLLHRFLYQIAARRIREAAIIYDPACEFVAAHFNASRGDIILNPLDERFPFWSLVFEIKQPTDRGLVAESFFPGRDEPKGSSGQFFTTASRDIFGRMLEFAPTPQEMIKALQNAELIDEAVKGTEHAHYIDPNAGNQRGGVLGSLASVGKTLKLLPAPQQCRGQVSLTEWALARRGWIFITSTQDTRESLRPLHAAFLDILMKRLMSVPPAWGRENPCWVFVDEVHALKRLPALYNTTVEGRKYGLKLVQGTQGKSEYEANYGPQARTMLAAAHTKIFLRCNEAESAKWIAEMIGDEEKEKPKIGTTASVADAGRDSINYSTVTERRPVVSREQIMSLPNLNGFWKYEDKVVGFRIPYCHVRQVADEYIPRQWNENSTPHSASINTAQSATQTSNLGGTDAEQNERARQQNKAKDQEPREQAKRQRNGAAPPLRADEAAPEKANAAPATPPQARRTTTTATRTTGVTQGAPSVEIKHY